MRLSRMLLAGLAFPLVAGAQQQQAGGPSVSAQLDPKEYEVPWGRQGRPRDPYRDAQGRVWFVGQAGNYIAYVDSRTGEFKRYEIDEGTHPHNIVVDPKGGVWFTGNRNGRLVKLNPADGKLTTYMVPDSTVRDPHTMIFDPSGIAWFSAQQAGKIGRFDPATGQFRLWDTGPRTRPYGVEIDPQGRPWTVLFGTNKIAMIDPKTLEYKEFTLPNERTRPRRLAITSDGGIWYGDYGRGYLGRLDPRTGAVEEWPMPAGAASLPYAMATDDRDHVWLNESGIRPNTLVAFDTKNKRWAESTPIGRDEPNTIRHMVFDKQTREIWFGTDQGTIGRIKVPPVSVVP